jgi:predicted Zn-dependent protease
MNKRLAALEKMVQSGVDDPFAWYGLAMEYRKEGRVDDALATFTTLRDKRGEYLPMYLMAGQMLAEAQRSDEARLWFSQGIELARAKGDGKTLSELQSALGLLD